MIAAGAPEIPISNSKAGIERRMAAGSVAWTGPLLTVFARSFLAILAQASVVLIYAWLRHPDPLRASTPWWQVTGTAVDLGCLALLVWLTRREGIRLVDLIGFNRQKIGRDVLVGLGMLVVVAPVAMIGGSILSGLLIYGKVQPALPAEVMTKTLPLWAALYSRILWWPVWSVVEQMTYNGYALPRLQALTGGRTWLAVLIVGVMWALQHSFLPFIPDGRVFLYLFVQMLPLVIVMQLLYLRIRRLPSLIVVHWGMDLFSAIAMISVI